MPGPWDAVAERKLLLCIIDPKATPKWDIIAGRMGKRFTGEACRQKYYKLKNQSVELSDRGSASSTPLKPRPGSNKIVKSSASARARKWKRALEVITAEFSEPEDEPAPSQKPMTKAIANVPFNVVYTNEPEVKPEDANVKWESDEEYTP